MDFLHKRDDFQDLLNITAAELGIHDPYLVEKDYWIMHCLWGLQNLGFNFELKGGTSLSKGYQCINRFSEDIDIKIIPDEKKCRFKVYAGKNHGDSKHIESRKKYFEWVRDQLDGKIDGFTSSHRDTLFDNPDFQSGGIRLYYKSHFATATGLKEGVLLELGFDRTTPNRALNISSWALEKAQKTTGFLVFDNSAINVFCYEPKHTFVEKLQAVIKKFQQYKSDSPNSASLPINFIRHYYDLFQLIDRDDVQKFIGTSEYNEFKKERFKSLDTKVSNSEALKLLDQKDRKVFDNAYNRSAGLYYKARPTLDEILSRFEKDLNRL